MSFRLTTEGSIAIPAYRDKNTICTSLKAIHNAIHGFNHELRHWPDARVILSPSRGIGTNY